MATVEICELNEEELIKKVKSASELEAIKSLTITCIDSGSAEYYIDDLLKKNQDHIEELALRVSLTKDKARYYALNPYQNRKPLELLQLRSLLVADYEEETARFITFSSNFIGPTLQKLVIFCVETGWRRLIQVINRSFPVLTHLELRGGNLNFRLPTILEGLSTNTSIKTLEFEDYGQAGNEEMFRRFMLANRHVTHLRPFEEFGQINRVCEQYGVDEEIRQNLLQQPTKSDIERMCKEIIAQHALQKAMEEQKQRALDDYIKEEKRQREMIELLQKNMEMYHVKQMTSGQQAYRNFLKDIKHLSVYRSKIEHTKHPLRCFISYAWEEDDSANKALQKHLLRIKDDLQVAGMQVTLDIRNMKYNIEKCMIIGIKKSHKVLLICTPRLKDRVAAQHMNNLQLEFNTVLDKAKKDSTFIVPLIMSGSFQTAVPPEIERSLALDFTAKPPPQISLSPSFPSPLSSQNATANLLQSTSQIPPHGLVLPTGPVQSPTLLPPPPFSLSEAEYLQAMTATTPMGLIPMLLGLDDNKQYNRFLDILNKHQSN